MPQKDKIDVIADAIRPGLTNPSRAREAAQAAVGALMSAGYTITGGRTSGPLGVGRRPPPRGPIMTNAIAGDGQRRGVFERT